jgi:ribosomal protein S18 acetylase RimI-like enzyme
MSQSGLPVRRGRPSDAAALAAFAERTFSETFAAANRPEDMASYIPTAYGANLQALELSNPDIITLIIEDGDVLAAYAQVRRGEVPDCVKDPAPVELWRFYVDRPFHGRGFAQRLMAAVHDAAVELGGRTVWLGVWERNERAIAFYTKAGFRTVGSHDFWVGADRQTDNIMVAEAKPQ